MHIQIEKSMSNMINENNVATVSYESTHMLPKNIRSHPLVNKSISFWKLIFDIFSLIIIFISSFLLKQYGKPTRRAFLCADLSLYYPPPKDNLFPKQRLYICSILLPVSLLLLSESIRWFYSCLKNVPSMIYRIELGSKVFKIPKWIGDLYIVFGTFFFAHAVNSLLTNIGKLFIGAFRPHFIASCFKKFTPHNFCTDATQWIVNYTCFGEDSPNDKIQYGAYNIRKSFPSSHSSTAFCGLIFLALYIHKTWSHRHLGFFPYVAETACFSLAACIGISRLVEHRHYGPDVVAGCILGGVIAIIAYRHMVRSFKRAVIVNLDNGITTEQTDLDIAP